MDKITIYLNSAGYKIGKYYRDAMNRRSNEV